jgi:hypothetical protein
VQRRQRRRRLRVERRTERTFRLRHERRLHPAVECSELGGPLRLCLPAGLLRLRLCMGQRLLQPLRIEPCLCHRRGGICGIFG